MPASDLLLLSSSVIHGHGYLEYARDVLTTFLKPGTRLAFVPYALADHDRYTSTVSAALEPMGFSVIGMHTVDTPTDLLDDVDAVFVGGGNSFRLLKTIQELGLIEPIRTRVQTGQLRYMGSSAGTNMACPSIRTTNDMPIVQPANLDAFGLIPFQINPHYQDPDPNSTHMGETRAQRIDQFHEENDVAVVGLREGSWIRRSGNQLHLGGVPGARLFRRGHQPVEYRAVDDLSSLLKAIPRFDVGE